jgi:hypothetical protein
VQLVAYFRDFQLTWSYFLDQLVAGLTLGSLYGLIAIGYSMVYGILKLLNFAHGEVFMIGSYIGYFVLTWLGRRRGSEHPGRGHDRADVPRRDCSGPERSAVVIERFAYRPFVRTRLPDRAPDQRARSLVLPAATRGDSLRLGSEAVQLVRVRRPGRCSRA